MNDFETDSIAAALADGEEHGYSRGTKEERARIRRALMRAARVPISGLGSAIFAETQSKPRHLCNYEEVALNWLKNALAIICSKEKQ